MKRVSLSIALAGIFAANSASAHGPYVVIKDDGTLNGTIKLSPQVLAGKIVRAYKATGQTLPDVISLWTNFSMDGNDVETLFDVVSNDVKGIGLESQYGGDGTVTSAFSPLRSILLHNNVTALPKRAAEQGAPIENFAQYIYLLEFSHNWGPAVQLPAEADAGADAGAANPGVMIGFPFHWSFFFDPGGMAGGNPWQDMGGGSFSVTGQSPSTIKYSPLDLYIMGLADKSEVPPFGVIENAVVPFDVKDPFTGATYNASSFPWWGATPFTVTGATRRTVTIDDVIAQNGPRVPDVTTSPKTFNIGIVLDVAADATDDEIAAAEADLDPIAATYPQAFHDATGGRGTFTIATTNTATDDDAGVGDDGGSTDGEATPSSSGSSGGCNVTETAHDRTSWLLFASGLVAGAAGLIRRRKQNR
ncbi:MAG: hypothetical protein ABI183_16520 [Polyangiaceae bacterium]